MVNAIMSERLWTTPRRHQGHLLPLRLIRLRSEPNVGVSHRHILDLLSLLSFDFRIDHAETQCMYEYHLPRSEVLYM